MRESEFQKKVLKLIRDRGGYAENIWGGGFQSAGIPDVLACYKGKFIGLELKVGKNKPSAIQLAKVKMINDAGGIALVVWDDIKIIEDILDEIDGGDPD